MRAKTREPQYGRCVEIRDKEGLETLGLGTNQLWHDDPKHLLFLLSRYKFAAKMLDGCRRVLEIGCGDGFGSRLVRQTVGHLTAVDFDPVFIEDAQARARSRWKVEFLVHDITQAPVKGPFDAVYSLDVIEHIPAAKETRFMKHVVRSLSADGVALIGTPSLASQVHASSPSKAGHVNCKDHHALRKLMGRYFKNVFIFSMNDEVVHTGFYPMAHYLLALGCGPRKT